MTVRATIAGTNPCDVDVDVGVGDAGGAGGPRAAGASALQRVMEAKSVAGAEDEVDEACYETVEEHVEDGNSTEHDNDVHA